MGAYVNPGTRLAADHRNGTMYVVYQRATAKNANGTIHVQYKLNRSTNAGSVWRLNGSTTGLIVAEGDSKQPTPKFGSVNALLGGADAVAVDSTNGSVYVMYGTATPRPGTTGWRSCVS